MIILLDTLPITCELPHTTFEEHVQRIIAESERHSLTLQQTAYVLATAHHESLMGLRLDGYSDGSEFEDQGAYNNTQPGDGPRFHARGYLGLVGRKNYEQWSDTFDIPIVEDPDLAAQPDIAAQILVSSMALGTFSDGANKLADHIYQEWVDYVSARSILGRPDYAGKIAGYARSYEAGLRISEDRDPNSPNNKPIAAPETDVSSTEATTPDPTPRSTGTAESRDLAAQRPVDDVSSVQNALKTIGFPITADGDYGPITERTVTRFQEGWTFEKLSIDGDAGPKTKTALDLCVQRGGRLSVNFRFSEFRSKGNGDIRVRRELVEGLEAVRSAVGKPLSLVSSYRDPAHNRKVGGVSNSRHLYGEAVDISGNYGLTLARARSLRKFTGIGYYARNNRVRHLDVRGLPSKSPASSRTTSNPSLWTY